MNQTKKRLAIIKLAISMTDTETIQLQVLKLGLLKTDAKMREILLKLNEQNYAQAQRLISAYIETPNESTIIQRTSQKDAVVPMHIPLENTEEMTTSTIAKPSTPVHFPSEEEAMLAVKEPEVPQEKVLSLKEKIQQAKDQAIIDQFELFTEDNEEESKVLKEEISYNDLLDIAPKPKKMSTENVNYDALLQVDADDVLVDNIELDISDKKRDDFFHEKLTIKADKKHEEDDFFDKIGEKQISTEAIAVKDVPVEETPKHEPLIKNHVVEDLPKESKISKVKSTPLETTPERYSPISYIDQKFKNMVNQYPSVDESTESFTSVDTWLIQISKEGYTENEVEKTMQKTERLSQNNKAEAAQLLLVTAATESKYAQFRLARALYKGDILKKNLAEAFTIINRLAVNDDYPEAICDLAQFYENGIGITKDKEKAEALYKDAMDLGIHRAIDHYERLRKGSKGLFASFRK
jgi:hypothetical protein